MSHIFISHVEEDAEIAREIADGLEAAGYGTWYYQRDTVPGAEYLTQVGQAIEQSQAIVLLVSPASVESHQVTNEVVRAYESRKRFIPALSGITDADFKEHQPLWRQALGASTSVVIPAEGVSSIIPRIIDGLKALAIEPTVGGERALPHEPTPATYTPKHLADKIIAARPAMEGERKQVTVLFAEVTGFTSMSEKLDPEEAHELVRQCVDYFTEEIHCYEGTIAQFLGDGVMALFGAPIAHEDAPQRALHAALGIGESLERYADRLREEGIEFEGRIGVNTGLVVVSRIGEDLTMEYTAVGDTVKLASEMASTATAGMTCVAENTYRLTKDYFEFKPLDKVQVKGEKEPVKTYELLGAGVVRSRLGAAVARGLTHFVGRRKELEHLSDCLARARDGQGQVVGVVGEAGVGKSRLILEFRGMLLRDGCTYLEGRCLHYGGSMAYLPLLDILRSHFDIEEGEQESIIKNKLEEKITRLDEKLMGILPPLHDLLSLRVEDEQYLKLDPQKKRERTFEAIRNLLLRESQDRPLILAVEDLHWIDNTSEDFLNYVIGWLASARILLVLLYRPEYTHSWGSKSYYSQIRVDQLSTKTSAELVQSILQEGEVVSELGDLILSKAGGNPLFVEEFTHTLLENGSIHRKNHQYVLSTKASDIQVPDTIQGIIAARMDRLDESLKETLQVASVIGRDFAFRILHTITGMQEELKSYLLDLQSLEFIYEKNLFPELEYIFKHALTQEVAYNSLLLRMRKKIHDRIGKAIEQLYRDRLEEFYEVLAIHYSRSENWQKAYQYFKLSGDKAARNYSNWEAFRLYKEAINALNREPDTDENKTRQVEVRLSMDYPMTCLGYPEDSLQMLLEGERLAREVGDEKCLAMFCNIISCCYTSMGQPAQARKYAEDCFKEAERVQDAELMVPSGYELCASYNVEGQFLKALDVAPKVIALLERTQRQSEYFGRPFNTYSALLGQYGHAMGFLGDFEEAEATCEKALRFALDINNLYSVVFIELHHGMVCAIKGDGRNAVEHFQNQIRQGEEIQFTFFSGAAWAGLGLGCYLLGELDTARKHAEKAIMMAGDAGTSLGVSIAYFVLSMVHLDSGDLENAQSCVEEALKLSQSNNERYTEGLVMATLGRILGKADSSRSDKAEECILEGIRILDELKVKPFYCMGCLYLGELYADMGRREKALETLKKAETAFQAMGMDYWPRRTQEVLDRLQG